MVVGRDLAEERIAEIINADVFLILTGVDKEKHAQPSFSSCNYCFNF
jgi:carbamate kinase